MAVPLKDLRREFQQMQRSNGLDNAADPMDTIKHMGPNYLRDITCLMYRSLANCANSNEAFSSDEEEDVRFLKGLTVYEVSPVLVGANQETYTMAIKSNTELLEDIADAKAVMTTGSMNEPDPAEEAEEVEEAPAEEVEAEEAPAEEVEADPEAEEIAEERFEARAAMGPGVEMVNIVTGERYTT